MKQNYNSPNDSTAESEKNWEKKTEMKIERARAKNRIEETRKIVLDFEGVRNIISERFGESGTISGCRNKEHYEKEKCNCEYKI